MRGGLTVQVLFSFYQFNLKWVHIVSGSHVGRYSSRMFYSVYQSSLEGLLKYKLLPRLLPLVWVRGSGFVSLMGPQIMLIPWVWGEYSENHATC